jgi:hypothetical protein
MNAEDRILGVKTRNELVDELVRLHRRVTALEPARELVVYIGQPRGLDNGD